MDRIREAIFEVLKRDQPMTVRQLFYRLVSLGTIDKTEAEYKATVCRLTTEMRRAGEIPYGWIADNTRWMRKPRTYSGLKQLLKHTVETYRRAVWDNQHSYVEVWLLHSARTEGSQATILTTRSSRCRIFAGSGRPPQLC